MHFTKHKPLVDGNDTYDPSGTYYKGQYRGYLYGHWNEANQAADQAHISDGVAAATNIQPRCANGDVCLSTGKIVVLAMGMSNWTKEICADQPQDPPLTMNYQLSPANQIQDAPSCAPNGWSFINKVSTPSQLNSKVILVDCAEFGAVAYYWRDDMTPFPGLNNATVYDNCDSILANWPGGPLTKNQVQAVLYKNADSGEDATLQELPASGFTGCDTLPGRNSDPCTLIGYYGGAARTIQRRYPYVRQMFMHSRIYAGFADPAASPLNPEPHAYEQGFAIKWFIQYQMDDVNNTGISHPTIAGALDYTTSPPEAPWIDWGAYMWSNAHSQNAACQNCPMQNLDWEQKQSGPTPCPQGQECDFQAVTGIHMDPDNTHPSKCGRDKVSAMLIHSYCTSPYMNWLPLQRPCGTAPPNTCSYGQ